MAAMVGQASERKVSYEEGLQLARRQGLKLSVSSNQRDDV